MHRRLFVASWLSLATCGMAFGVHATALAEAGPRVPVEAGFSALALAMATYGIGCATAVASPLCDAIGMRPLLLLAGAAHVLGLLGLLLAPGAGSDAARIWAKASLLLCALAHGIVEGVVNPLVLTLRPATKVKHLNLVHASWPAGIAVGSALASASIAGGLDWRLACGACLLPALGYVLATREAVFPPTERQACGVSARAMARATLLPAFLLLAALAALAAATGRGTTVWMLASFLPQPATNLGLPWIVGAGILCGLRCTAGPIADRLSPVGLLAASAMFVTLGLWLFAGAQTDLHRIVAAVAFCVGSACLWPTLLAVASERFPATGALGMGVMAAAGAVGSTLGSQRLGAIQAERGPAVALEAAAWPAVALFVAFFALALGFAARGGYRAERLRPGR
jgi:MFS family permease